MKKITKYLLTLCMLFCLFNINTVNIKANDNISTPFVVALPVEFSDKETQTYTFGSDKISVTVAISGTYYIYDRSYAGDISVTPRVTYTTTGNTFDLSAKLTTVKKEVNGLGYTIIVNTDIYSGATYKGGLEFKFSV